MKHIIAAIALLASIAQAQDYQGAVVYHIETTSTNVVPFEAGQWQTEGLFELYAHPGVHGVRCRSWQVPDCTAPSEADIAALATNATAQAYRSIPRTAEEVAWTNLITAVGGTLPVAEGDIMALAANIKGQIAAKQVSKDAAVTAQDWATAFELQDDINKLTEQGTEITALSGVLGSRKYQIK